MSEGRPEDGVVLRFPKTKPHRGTPLGMLEGTSEDLREPTWKTPREARNFGRSHSLPTPKTAANGGLDAWPGAKTSWTVLRQPSWNRQFV